MDDGELLYNAYCMALDRFTGPGLHASFFASPISTQYIWREAARLFLQTPMVGGVPIPTPRDWKNELKKYGRHAPGCPASGPCSCGFEAIEKELVA